MFDKYLNNKNKLIATITRVILFFVLFLISLAIIYFLFAKINFVNPYTYILSKSFENKYSVETYSDYSGFNIMSESINILDVCTGWFELAVFIALIIATIDVSIKRRIIGILILIPLFLLFNFARIYIIVESLLKFNYLYVDVLHTILFKAGLVLFFCLFYYIWLKRSTEEKVNL